MSWARSEKEINQLLYQMHSAGYTNLIHQCLQCLTSLIMSFKCTTIISEKLKEDKITAGYKIRSTASFSKLFINHQFTTSSMLFFTLIIIIVLSSICTMTSFRPLLTKHSSDTLISTSWNLWARKRINTWFKNWYH